AQNQQPQHEHEREIESAEARRVQRRKRDDHRAAGGEQPHLVAVPDRTDRVDEARAILARPADDEVHHADAEIEAVEHGVADEHHPEHEEPERVNHAPAFAFGSGEPGPSWTMRMKIKLYSAPMSR